VTAFPGRRRAGVPYPQRTPLRWPNGARMAIWVVPNIEWFEPDSLDGSTIATPAKALPDVPNWTWREYGNTVGIWRTAAILKRLDIKATVALNSRICTEHPEIVSAAVDLGWEFMGHGRANSHPITGLGEADERALIADTLTTIQRATGKRVAGWLGPGLAETEKTLDVLAEHGVTYVGDWLCDDEPFALETASGDMWSMPYSLESNDIGTFLRRFFTAPEYAEMLRDHFDVLYAESEASAKIMCVATHPFITGVPFRAKHLEAALTYMRERKDVWFATGSEILAAFREARAL
jgi:allantoinase